MRRAFSPHFTAGLIPGALPQAGMAERRWRGRRASDVKPVRRASGCLRAKGPLPSQPGASAQAGMGHCPRLGWWSAVGARLVGQRPILFQPGAPPQET